MMTITFGVENSEAYNARMHQFIEDVAVYPVSCESLTAGRGDRVWLEEVLSGGAKIVQLRDKESKDNVLLEKARFFREKTLEAGALFLVNDRLDIALLAEADGIHVGQGDLPPEEIRRLAPDMIVGLSCNSERDVVRLGALVEQKKCPVSYYNVGPIYPTGTKEGLHSFLGPESITAYTSHCSLPYTVMGGIKFHHIDELLRSGAKRIAVVTALSQAENIAAETARWQRKIQFERFEMQGVQV